MMMRVAIRYIRYTTQGGGDDTEVYPTVEMIMRIGKLIWQCCYLEMIITLKLFVMFFYSDLTCNIWKIVSEISFVSYFIDMA